MCKYFILAEHKLDSNSNDSVVEIVPSDGTSIGQTYQKHPLESSNSISDDEAYYSGASSDPSPSLDITIEQQAKDLMNEMFGTFDSNELFNTMK